MKTILIVITALFFLTRGCARTHYLSHVVDEWGPPGKIEETETTTTYF